MVNEHLRLKIQLVSEEIEEARARKSDLMSELRLQCEHPVVARLDDVSHNLDRTKICCTCALEVPYANEMYFSFGHKVIPANKFEDYNKWRL